MGVIAHVWAIVKRQLGAECYSIANDVGFVYQSIGQTPSLCVDDGPFSQAISLYAECTSQYADAATASVVMIDEALSYCSSVVSSWNQAALSSTLSTPASVTASTTVSSNTTSNRNTVPATTSATPTSAIPAPTIRTSTASISATTTSAIPAPTAPTSAIPTSATPTSTIPTSATLTSATPTSVTSTSVTPTSVTPTTGNPTSATPIFKTPTSTTRTTSATLTTLTTPTTSATLITTSLVTSPTALITTSTSASQSIHHDLSSGAIAGITIGSTIAVLLILAFVILFIWYRRRTKKQAKEVAADVIEQDTMQKAQLHSDDYKPRREELAGSYVPPKVRAINGLYEVEYHDWKVGRGELSANEVAIAEKDGHLDSATSDYPSPLPSHQR